MQESSPQEGYPQQEFSVPTKRYCQTLDLRDRPEFIQEYRRLHSETGVWEETLQAIRNVGILEMEIYLVGCRLFMIVETPVDFEWDEAMSRMAQMPRQKEWEALTGQYQQAHEGATSDEKWQMMERIFHLYH